MTSSGKSFVKKGNKLSQSDMVAFVRAVERGGFSAAARDLGLTPSAVSKLVTRLEDRLGVRLLNRTTRSLALTAEGEAFFQRSQRILADIAEAEEEVGRTRAQPRGLLRVNVGTAFGMHQLVPALPDFLSRYPEIQVELTLTFEDAGPETTLFTMRSRFASNEDRDMQLQMGVTEGFRETFERLEEHLVTMR